MKWGTMNIGDRTSLVVCCQCYWSTLIRYPRQTGDHTSTMQPQWHWGFIRNWVRGNLNWFLDWLKSANKLDRKCYGGQLTPTLNEYNVWKSNSDELHCFFHKQRCSVPTLKWAKLRLSSLVAARSNRSLKSYTQQTHVSAKPMCTPCYERQICFKNEEWKCQWPWGPKRLNAKTIRKSNSFQKVDQ